MKKQHKNTNTEEKIWRLKSAIKSCVILGKSLHLSEPWISDLPANPGDKVLSKFPFRLESLW